MEQVLTIKKTIIISLVQFGVLLALATVAPLLGHQAFVGPTVNAVLFIAIVILGIESAVFISLAPSLIALSVGLLPVVLAPMVPFIMTGNIILVFTFNFLRKKNYWLGVVIASFFKFLFLFFSSSMVINLLLKKEIAEKAALMMGWPQFFTALAGGILAYLFLKRWQAEKQGELKQNKK